MRCPHSPHHDTKSRADAPAIARQVRNHLWSKNSLVSSVTPLHYHNFPHRRCETSIFGFTRRGFFQQVPLLAEIMEAVGRKSGAGPPTFSRTIPVPIVSYTDRQSQSRHRKANKTALDRQSIFADPGSTSVNPRYLPPCMVYFWGATFSIISSLLAHVIIIPSGSNSAQHLVMPVNAPLRPAYRCSSDPASLHRGGHIPMDPTVTTASGNLRLSALSNPNTDHKSTKSYSH